MAIVYPQLDGVKINEDRTLPVALIQAIRKAYDLINQTEATAIEIASGGGGGGSGDGGGGDEPESTGEVTGFSFAGEVRTRYADAFDRLVHLTIGFTPIVEIPRTVTYLISNDAKATWVWIGSQKLKATDQILYVDRLAIADDANWAVACIAGNQGGDPVPIPNDYMLALYPGIVVSALFPVAGLRIPPTNQNITATIGVCSNVVTSDGLTQYGVIPGVIYTDPVNSTDFFVRITVQDLDSLKHPLSTENPHGGTQITGSGDQHKETELQVTYTPGLAFVRYRFYVASKASQGAGDFADPTTNKIQMVFFNGSGVAQDHYDVPITIPPFTPVDPTDVFNVVSVNGREVGPKYQDEQAGLHTVVALAPVLDVGFTKPHTVTFWLDFGNGVKVWQGWYDMSFVGQEIKIGEQTLGSDGTRKSGTIWVPANAAQGNWIVYCAPGRVDKNVSPVGYPHGTFVVIPVKACSPTGITNCHFLPDPTTSDPITYYKDGLGHWFWEYYKLQWTPPTQLAEPDFWFALITIQKGATIGGVWTPAPDPEGRNQDPYLNYLGRMHVQVMTVPGLALDQTVIMERAGAYPSTWVIPPTQNVDLSPYPYRDFRFWIYSVSRLGTDSSGSGGAGTYTLQTSCWPGGADHFTLSPAAKVGDLDLRYANPNTIGDGLKGGAGTVIDIDATTIVTYIPDDGIIARHMHEDSITAANKALAANSVVDNNVKDVGIVKLISGTNIFTGDVILSRGSSAPVIVLQNSGINLFGVSDPGIAAPAAGGLTTKPNVAIQSDGISLFSGEISAGAVGASTTIVPAGITFWTKNGLTSAPYATMNNTGILLSDGGMIGSTPTPKTVTINNSGIVLSDGGVTGTTPTPNTVAINNTGFTVLDKSGAKLTVNATGITILMARSVAGNGNTQALINGSGASFTTGTGTGLMELVMDNTGLFLRRGGVSGPSVSFTATAITLQNNGTSGPQVNINTSDITLQSGTVSGPMAKLYSGGLELTNGTASVKITATSVDILKGSFNTSSSDYTVNINNTVGMKVTSIANNTFFQTQAVSTFAGGSVVAAVSDGTYGVNMRVVVSQVSPVGTYGQLELLGTGILPGVNPGVGATVRIFAGKTTTASAAGIIGYIAAQVDGADVRIPYYGRA